MSVIVPAFENQPVLDRCLQALHGESVIVVDDGSSNPLIAPNVIRIEREPNRRNRATACNAGAAVSNEEYLFFIDSNKVASPNAVDIAMQHLADMECALEQEVMITSRNQMMDESVILDHGSGTLLRKKSFQELGGYDEAAFPHWGFEGYDFSLRWLRDKRRIYSPRELVSEYIFDGHVGDGHRDMDRAEKEFADKWGKSRSDVVRETMRLM